jgi:hypothetical protein
MANRLAYDRDSGGAEPDSSKDRTCHPGADLGMVAAESLSDVMKKSREENLVETAHLLGEIGSPAASAIGKRDRACDSGSQVSVDREAMDG